MPNVTSGSQVSPTYISSVPLNFSDWRYSLSSMEHVFQGKEFKGQTSEFPHDSPKKKKIASAETETKKRKGKKEKKKEK